MHYLIGLGGIVLILAIAFCFSSNRRWIRLRVVGAAFALQAGLAVLVLGTPWGQAAIGAMSRGVSNLLGYATAGTDFIFGPLASPEHGRQQLRDRRAAGDHLLRLPDLDPLLSRHHAADHPLGRRRDPAGHRHHPGRIAGLGGEHLRRPVGEPAGHQALSRQPHPARSCSA